MQRSNRDLLLLILRNQLALANYIQCRDGASAVPLVSESQSSLLLVLDESLDVLIVEEGEPNESQLA